MTPDKKAVMNLALSSSEVANSKVAVTLDLMPGNPFMGRASLSLAPLASHIANPFNYLNDNVFNFSVRENSTEKWIYINADTQFYDDHPLHFHLTQGFYEEDETSFVNRHPSNFGSKDVYSIKGGTQVAFKIKFPNYNSETLYQKNGIRNLGFMFHCHYMMHHDMNMMGQFYVTK